RRRPARCRPPRNRHPSQSPPPLRRRQNRHLRPGQRPLVHRLHPRRSHGGLGRQRRQPGHRRHPYHRRHRHGRHLRQIHVRPLRHHRRPLQKPPPPILRLACKRRN